jgi:hypothetical protein
LATSVALYLNRRLRSQAIHDLNAVDYLSAVNGHSLRFKCRATAKLQGLDLRSLPPVRAAENLSLWTNCHACFRLDIAQTLERLDETAV